MNHQTSNPQTTNPQTLDERLAVTDLDTLDDARLDRIGVHLAVTAAADVAATNATTAAAPARPAASRTRRVLGGVALAAILGGGIFGANAILGGPGLARTPAAVAVAIEQQDGWTTIRILDPEASPATIEAQLRAAGLRVRTETVDLTPDANGEVHLADGATIMPGASGATAGESSFGLMGPREFSVATYGSAGPGELFGVSVTFPEMPTLAAPKLDGSANWDTDEYVAQLDDVGIRLPKMLGPEVSIRNGADVDIVLQVVA
jgi:hypothetical protein